MAVDTLVNITQDEIEYARMCNLIKSQLDYQSGMVNAKRKGHAEGRAEGHKEGRAEERQRLLDMLDQGLSVEEIKRQLAEL